MNETASYCLTSDSRILAVMRQILNTSILDASTRNGSYRPTGSGQPEVMRNAMLVLYLTTFAFGTLGNTVTVYALIRTKHLRSVANCFILNLAVADDLFLATLPFTAHNSYTSDWLFGPVLCKVMNVFRGVNLYASIFTMTLMSIDRYLAVVHPFDSLKYRTRRNALVVCAVTWAICLVIMTPLWLYSDAVTDGMSGKTLCRVCWPRRRLAEHLWMWANFELAIGFLVPIVVMAVCYVRLLRRLLAQPRSPVRRQRKTQVWRVTAMLFVVTVVFLVCWAPHHVIKLLAACIRMTIVDRERSLNINPKAMIAANIVAQNLPFISSCCNPFIYYITSTNFRQIYKTVLCSCSPTVPLTNYGSSTRSSGVFHSQRRIRRRSGSCSGSGRSRPGDTSIRKQETELATVETCQLEKMSQLVKTSVDNNRRESVSDHQDLCIRNC